MRSEIQKERERIRARRSRDQRSATINPYRMSRKSIGALEVLDADDL